MLVTVDGIMMSRRLNGEADVSVLMDNLHDALLLLVDARMGTSRPGRLRA